MRALEDGNPGDPREPRPRHGPERGAEAPPRRAGDVGAEARVRRMLRGDAGFPPQLLAVPDPPDVLYVCGGLVSEDALAVAVVGSRRPTAYGVTVAERLAAELARRGVTVVSGLARGIDSAAHRGAIQAGGRTVAVLGSGVDVVYPPENRRLAQRIEEQGAVVSQFPLGTPPLPHHFPVRNRVIAGLALGVVVVEAAERSGSLITAALAAELGREVMAVPGRVTSDESRGTNRLIQDGAALVQGWADVVAQLPDRWRRCVRDPAAPPAPDEVVGGSDASEDAARVLAVLDDEPVSMEYVIERSGLDPGPVAALLLSLELAGRVRQLAGARFVRASQG
jgi:DNA processing protein